MLSQEKCNYLHFLVRYDLNHNTIAYTVRIFAIRYVMFRHLISYIILLTLLLQTFSVYLLKADYVLNQQLYEQQCINKQKPALKCHGKCQMAKKMAEAEKKEQQQSGNKNKQTGLDEIVLTISYSDFSLYRNSISSSIRTSVSDVSIRGFYGDVFQPPRIS